MLTRFVASDEGVDCFGGEPQASPRFHDKRKALIVAVEPARRAAETSCRLGNVEKAAGFGSAALTASCESLEAQAHLPSHALKIPKKGWCILNRNLGGQAFELA